ncbi:hypothetical protein CO005_01155 [Candidatus Roizmanbacteria bacterium CG_4_8_14_3_um_filter_34_9]|uniref:Uncharacterized protein n=2 Tax=Candidatus Roizmaniibacteriota TaxID=1752723 RepID=A0A2M6YUC6_9BACT|nr:MAG: hypothetical protein COT02_02610 [Candidatus Roizmanbacteria bacterium CG07_land_8_20_14_0_80_34_15]PIW73497.1 MAG: hypothetical protein CO005_01155 [Candidatus Roizmanbacteria bacterium CG_4_8_14_3_um_filter_34_9]
MNNSQKPTAKDFIQAEELRQFIEKEVLKVIDEMTKREDTTKEKIQGIAKITIELIKPGMKLDELYQNAVKLDDNCSELGPIVVLIMREYEEKYAKKALTQVSQLIKNKKYDEAQNVVKKILQYKIAN